MSESAQEKIFLSFSELKLIPSDDMFCPTDSPKHKNNQFPTQIK